MAAVVRGATTRRRCAQARTADRFANGYYLNSPTKNPQGPRTGMHRAIRGSSIKTDAGSAAVYHRYGRQPSFEDDELGFRCAK